MNYYSEDRYRTWLSETSNPDAKPGPVDASITSSLVDRITELVERRCDCGTQLDECSPSLDFCSPECQARWQARNVGGRASYTGTRVPIDHPATPTARLPEHLMIPSEDPFELAWEIIGRATEEQIHREFTMPNPLGILSATDRAARPHVAMAWDPASDDLPLRIVADSTVPPDMAWIVDESSQALAPFHVNEPRNSWRDFITGYRRDLESITRLHIQPAARVHIQDTVLWAPDTRIIPELSGRPMWSETGQHVDSYGRRTFAEDVPPCIPPPRLSLVKRVWRAATGGAIFVWHLFRRR